MEHVGRGAGAEAEPERLRVLVASANQRSRPLHLDDEIRAIRDALAMTAGGRRADVMVSTAVEPRHLVTEVSELRPQVVHFSGHGTDAGIELAVKGSVRSAGAEALRSFFDDRGVDLVVLNSCYSAAQAAEIAKAVPVVIGTDEKIDNRAAGQFSQAFYQALARGRTAADAMRDGQDAVSLTELAGSYRLCGDGSTVVTTATERRRRPLLDVVAAASASVPGRLVTLGIALALAWLALNLIFAQEFSG